MKTKMQLNQLKSVLFLFLSLWVFTSAAQTINATDTKHNEKKEKMQAAKVAYLTDKLSLTAAEAEKFWPVYNEYQDRRDLLQKEFRKKIKVLKEKGVDLITEEQADEIINSHLTNEQSLLDLKKEYFPKFKKVIGSKKVAKMYVAERDFNKLLIDQLKEK